MIGVLACSPRDPNVVLISVDTLRPDHLGLYGYERDTSPEIDRFFERGSRFSNAISSAPCTIPAVRQFLSGGFDVRPERPSIAEALRERGYETAAIVSQHQFDYRTQRDYARGFDHFDMQGPEEIDHHRLTTRTADQVSDRALGWLADRDGPSPFFLWLHYFDPHDPYEPPPEYRLFGSGNESRRSGDRRSVLMEEGESSSQPWPLAGAVFSDEDVAHLVALYDAEIRFTDAQIGRVFASLEKRDWVDDAIVVLTADHGEWLGEGHRWDHCLSVLEQEIRVPLLIRARGGQLAGAAKVAEVASTLDLVPTILGLVGVDPIPDAYQGTDLRHLAQNRVALAMWDDLVAARKREWKLIVEGRRAVGLYQIAEDGHEVRNLLGKNDEVQQELFSSIHRAQPLRSRVERDWQEAVEQLRSIGYVE